MPAARIEVDSPRRSILVGLLLDIQGRISAISLIHETLYQSDNLAQVDFLVYMEAPARSLESALAPAARQFSLHCRGDPIELPIDRAMTGYSEGGRPFLVVEDNGVGVPQRVAALLGEEAAGAEGDSHPYPGTVTLTR